MNDNIALEKSRQLNLDIDRKTYIKEEAKRRAMKRAQSSRWDLNILIFLFGILIIILILLFQDVAIEIVAPIAFLGLVMVWCVGRRQGVQMYRQFYDEDLLRLSQHDYHDKK